MSRLDARNRNRAYSRTPGYQGHGLFSVVRVACAARTSPPSDMSTPPCQLDFQCESQYRALETGVCHARYIEVHVLVRCNIRGWRIDSLA